MKKILFNQQSGTVFLFLFLLVLQLAGCSEPKRLKDLEQNAIILAFGDSLTAGVGTTPPNDYPSVLSELTGLRVINAGVPGETSAQGVKRLPVLLEEFQPNLLILLEGGNDILRNKDKIQLKQNLAEMIGFAQKRGIDVVLIGVPERKLFSDSAPLYGELATEYEVVFEEQMLANLLRKIEYKSDTVHLNQAGYRVMAEQLFSLLIENGAL